MYLLFQLVRVDSYLLVDELISPKDIDPVHRYVPRQDQRNVSMRYSNQVSCLMTAIITHSLWLCRGGLRCSSGLK